MTFVSSDLLASVFFGFVGREENHQFDFSAASIEFHRVHHRK
jgi:hypothetical protein